MSIKTCSNTGCNENRIEEFHKIADTDRRHTQCRECLAKKDRARKKKNPKPKVRIVNKMDSGLANDMTMMKW